MKFSYQLEKFSLARRALMLPHPDGEAASIVSAFFEISHALHQFDRSQVPDEVRDWLRKTESFMEVTGLADPANEGLYKVRAGSLTTDEKLELSHLVDELAHWFRRADQ